MIGRRKFLSAMGIGAVSAPIAAKAAVESEMANLTTLAGPNAKALSMGRGVAASLSSEDVDGSYIKMSQYLATFGKLPAHVEQDVRERARYVSFLDPDLVCKRSWSLSVKIVEQRQRNYDAEVERYKRSGWYAIAQSNFTKLTGFKWQW